MEIPRKVLNRLRLGRDIAAQITPSQTGNMAWIYVCPVTDACNFDGNNYGTAIETIGASPPIRYFFVRHLELEAAVAKHFLQDEYEPPDYPEPVVIDELYFPSSEEELEAALGRWVSDFSTLFSPYGARYDFESARRLIWNIIKSRGLEYGPGLIDQIKNGGFNGPKVLESEDRPLHYAARVGNVGQIQALLDSGYGIDTIKRGKTPLHIAASAATASSVKILLERGADPDILDDKGATPLKCAVNSLYRLYAANDDDGDVVTVVRLLLEHDADPNRRDDSNETILLTAIDTGNLAVITLLLDFGAEMEPKPSHKGRYHYIPETALTVAVPNASAEVVRFLIGRGADINARPAIGWGPLRYAINLGDREKVELLVAAGADVNPTDDEYKPLLAFAEELGDDWIVERLKSAGADYALSRSSPNDPAQ